MLDWNKWLLKQQKQNLIQFHEFLESYFICRRLIYGWCMQFLPCKRGAKVLWFISYFTFFEAVQCFDEISFIIGCGHSSDCAATAELRALAVKHMLLKLEPNSWTMRTIKTMSNSVLADKGLKEIDVFPRFNSYQRSDLMGISPTSRYELKIIIRKNYSN